MTSWTKSDSSYKPVPSSDPLYPDEEKFLISGTDDSEEETFFEINANGGDRERKGRKRRKRRKLPREREEEENEDLTYTVEEAVEAVGLGWFQIKIYIVCGVISATDALEMMLLAVLSPSVRCEWFLSDAQVAFVTTVVFIGMGISAPLLGYCGDKYGRKFTLFLVTLTIGFYGFLATFSPSYYWLLILRTIVGCGMGGSPQGTSLLSEYIPRKYRAKLLIFGQVFWACGVMFEIVLAAVVVPYFGWRWLLVGSAIPSLLSALGLLCVPESARFLIAAGERKKAIQILNDAARVNKSKLPPGQLADSSEVARGQFSNLFAPEYCRTTFQLWVLWFGFAFFYYGMVLASAEILRKSSPDGNNEAKCHCSTLSSQDYVTMMLSTLGEFVGLPLNFLLIDWLGRRKNAALIMLGAAISVSLLQLDMSRSVFTVLLFALRGFAAAFGNLMYIYSSEIYPTTIRTLGMGTASAWARVGAMLTPFVAQVLLSYSLSLACWLYAAVCLICSICGFLMPIETKERALPQSVSVEMLVLSTADDDADSDFDK